MQRPILPLVLLSAVAVPARAEILERIVAKVNGEIVTLTEFQTRQVAAAQNARVSADRVEGFLRENNARILQEAVDDLLLSQRAEDAGLKLRPEVVKDVIDGIKKENNIENDEALQEALRREGMSYDDLKRNVERNMLRRMVLGRDVEPKVTVTDDEVKAEYEAKKATDFTKPATVTLQEILIKKDDPEAAARVREVQTRAKAGEDFSALARQYSSAPTRSAGGDLGKLAHGELNPELEKAAFALPPGGISAPVSTSDGFRILKVVEKTEMNVVPLDQVKGDIRRKLAEGRLQKEYEGYMEGLRKKAIIETMVREVPLQLTGPLPESIRLDAGAGAGPGAEGAAAGAAPGAAAAGGAPAAGPPPPPADPDAEIQTTGQAQPERVVPPSLPGAPPPTPAAGDKDKKKKPEKKPGDQDPGGTQG
jgi:parvulin-like peptidyl-prolyl isomerase